MTLHETTTTLRAPLTALRRALLGVGLLSLAASASAGTITGGAFIDWSTLNIEFVHGEGSAAIDAPYSYVTGDSFVESQFDSNGDWTSSISITLNIPGSDNLTIADAGSLLTAASVDTEADYSYLSLGVGRGATLNILGDGILLVSVEATVGADVSAANFDIEYAYSESSAGMSLSNGSSYSGSSMYSSGDFFQFSTPFDLHSGLLTAAINVHNGDVVQFNTNISTYIEAGQFVSSVPIPASLPLLGTALLGLASIKRARRARDAALSEA